MPSKKQIDIESILNQLTLLKDQLQEINELEDKLNQERFLVNKDLNNNIVLLDNILEKYDNNLSKDLSKKLLPKE